MAMDVVRTDCAARRVPQAGEAVGIIEVAGRTRMIGQPVNSSNLCSVDYAWWSGTLTIEFRNGGIYEFYGVPQELHAGLMGASSHGSYFARHIRNRFRYRRLQ